MNLKPIAASLLALGVVSSPMLASAAPVSHFTKVVTQNSPESTQAFANWANRVRLSGLVNVDFKAASRTSAVSQDRTVPAYSEEENSSNLYVNNANLFVDGVVNKYVKAHVGLIYNADSETQPQPYQDKAGVSDFGNGINDVDSGDSFNTSVDFVGMGSGLNVEEAYLLISDFSDYPIYFKLGKQYQPFGIYNDWHPITYDFTQLLSQTRATSVQFGGVADNGLYGSVYVLNNHSSSDRSAGERSVVSSGYNKIDNWGANVGYRSHYNSINYLFDIGYIRDITDVDYLNALNVANSGSENFYRRSAGVSLSGTFSSGPFGLKLDYVTATKNLRDQIVESTDVAALNVKGSYAFPLFGHDTELTLGYENTNAGAYAALPKRRYSAMYGVDMWKHTKVIAEYTQARDYKEQQFTQRIGNNEPTNALKLGTGKRSNTIALRLSVEV